MVNREVLKGLFPHVFIPEDVVKVISGPPDSVNTESRYWFSLYGEEFHPGVHRGGGGASWHLVTFVLTGVRS